MEALSFSTQNCISLLHVQQYPLEELMTSDALYSRLSIFSMAGRSYGVGQIRGEEGKGGHKNGGKSIACTDNSSYIL